MAQTEQNTLSSARMAKRAIWFFMRTVLLILLLAGLCYAAFDTAMRAANLYILATEGLQLRAQCILQDGPVEEMRSYFSTGFIEEDTALVAGTYEDYTVKDFDYRVEVKGISVFPWSQTATVTVLTRMASMSGALNDDKRPEDAPADAVYPLPEWEEGRYLLRFWVKNGRWYIYQMQLLKAGPSEEPRRTPDPNRTPIPAATLKPAS